MKRLYALLLAALLLVCGCSGKENTSGAVASAENLAASLALSCCTAGRSDPVDISDPLFIWETIGWYTVYSARLAGTETTHITDADAASLLRILSPGSGDISLPQDFPYGSAVEGGYSFEGTKSYSDSYMGIAAELYTEAEDPLTYTVRIREHYDTETKEAEYRVSFAGTPNDFHLDSLRVVSVRSLPVQEPPHELDFTYDDLCRCNSLETLLGYGKTIRIVSEAGDASFICFTERGADGAGPSLWYSDGTAGYCRNFYIFTDAGRLHAIPMPDNGAWIDGYVSGENFDPEADMEYVSADQDSVTFRYSYDAFTKTITVNRGTLAIRTVQLLETGGKSMGVLRYEYGDFDVSSPFADDWNGNKRTVTLKMHNVSDGNAVWTTESFALPVSWELDPSGYCPWGTAWLDEDFTQEYVYPSGDGDYTVYVTAGKG